MNWDQIEIVCWKWNNGLHPKKKMVFGPDHVNTLASMLSRNVHRKYRLTCITDEPEGIDSSVRVLPIWDDYRDKGGCFLRLKAFASEMKTLIGDRIVSIDLDTVIVSDITELITRKEDFAVWGGENRAAPYCGSFWIMTAGSRAEVWTGFNGAVYQPTASGKYKRGTDQARISDALYPNEKMLGKADGIYNFEQDLRISGPLERMLDEYKFIRDLRCKELEKDIINQQKDEMQRICEENRDLSEKDMRARLEVVAQRVVKESEKRYRTLEGACRRKIAMAQRRMTTKRSIFRKGLPSKAKIIFFNGKWDPNNIVLQSQYSWIKENYR